MRDVCLSRGAFYLRSNDQARETGRLLNRCDLNERARGARLIHTSLKRGGLCDSNSANRFNGFQLKAVRNGYKRRRSVLHLAKARCE